MLLPDVLVHLHLELQALGEVDPVDPLGPGLPVAPLVEHAMEFVFGSIDVFIGRIEDEIVVLGEDGEEGGSLGFCGPGQLVDEAEEFGLVDGVPLGEAGDVEDAVETDFEAFELL